MFKRKYFILLLLIVVFLSCSKYEEGPFISLRTKKSRLIEKSWRVDEVFVDGVAISLQDTSKLECMIKICNFEETKYFIHQDKVNQNNFVETVEYCGEWKFVDNKKFIKVNYVEVDYANNTEEIKSLKKEILRLTNKEFWFKTNVNGCETEHHLKSK